MSEDMGAQRIGALFVEPADLTSIQSPSGEHATEGDGAVLRSPSTYGEKDQIVRLTLDGVTELQFDKPWIGCASRPLRRAATGREGEWFFSISADLHG